MKKIIILTLSLLLVQMQSYAQTRNDIRTRTVTIGFSGVSLERALFDLGRVSDFQMVFPGESVTDMNRTIDLPEAERTVEATLRLMLQGTNLEFRQSGEVVVVSVRQTAPVAPTTSTRRATRQQGGPITVAGRVSDATGETLPGVTILVIGTTIGTVTDINGRYSITVPDSDTSFLSFSFVGMRNSFIPVVGRSTINVVMEKDVIEIEQIVITGFHEVSAEAYTGAATVITSAQIGQRAVGSIEEVLRGLAPGLLSTSSGQPGAPGEVRLRGIGSMSAGNQPLYVVDGVVWDLDNETGNDLAATNPLTALNPMDIASITILRDAASAALYGSRGANGVIVITTHTGREGERPSFSFTTQSGFSSMLVRPQFVNGREYAELWTEGQMHFLIQQELARDNLTGRTQLLNVLKPLYADKNDYTFKGMNFNEWMKMARNDFNTFYAMPVSDGTFRNYDFFGEDYDKLPSTDWFREISRVAAPFAQANLSMRGSVGAIRYFASLGYFNQQGVVVNSQLQRYSMRVRLSSAEGNNQRITWNLNTSLSYNMQSGPAVGGQQFGSPLFGASTIPAAISPFLEDGAYNFLFPNNLLNTTFNPVACAYEIIRDRPTTRAIIQGWIQVNNIRPWLRFRSTNSMDYQLTRRRDFFDSRFGDGLTYNGLIRERDAHTYIFTSTNLFTANHSWNSRRHLLNVVSGGEFSNRWSRFNMFSTTNFGVNSKPWISMGARPHTYSGGGAERTLASLISTADYSYRLRYYISGSYRMDASSRFHPDYRVGNFWSVSGAYRISNETWFRSLVPQTIINNLRFRVSYGINGTLPTLFYQWRNAFETNSYSDNPGISQLYIPTPDLTWEGNRIWNLGMDVRMFSSRIRFSAEYYDRKSKDLLRDVAISSTTGFRTMLRNTDAGIHNRGFEFEARGMAFETKKHSLELSFNLATLKATYYGLEVIELDAIQRQILANGRSVHSWFAREWAGVSSETGQILFATRTRDSNNKVIHGTSTSSDDSPVRVLGQGVPKISGGFSMSYSYGPWTLDVLTSYGLGHHLWDRMLSRNASDGSNHNSMLRTQLDRWTPDNPYAASPLRINGSIYSSRHTRALVKGDYLKIRNIRLQYTLPSRMAEALKLQSAQIYVQAENPWVFSHIPGYDPESTLTGYRNSDAYPSVATFMLGLSINF